MAFLCGNGKPRDLEQYLDNFVQEVAMLERGFEVSGKHFTLKIHCVICDAPARSFIKNIKGGARWRSQ